MRWSTLSRIVSDQMIFALKCQRVCAALLEIIAHCPQGLLPCCIVSLSSMES
jgi:hypothetical protein